MFVLHAKVVEAKGLPTFEDTNIYTTLRVDESGFYQHTEKKASRNPKWNQEFDFDFIHRNGAILKVRVLNDDGIIDERVGIVRIPINSIQELNKEDDQWYKITNKQGETQGSIHLILKITQKDKSGSDVGLDDILNIFDDSCGESEFQKLIEPTKYLVSFTVINAEDIDKLTETKYFDFHPNFYAVLQIKGRKRIDKTCCKINNFHPVWNQTFNYHIEAKNLTVFNIKLKNHFVKEDKDIVLAENDFKFTDIPDDITDYDSWIEIPSTTVENEKCRLYIKIHFEPTV